MEIVRDEHQAVRLVERGGVFALERDQLIDGVVDGLLNTGAGIELLERNNAIDILRHPLGATVAVRDSIADRQANFIDEDEINAPSVDADTLRRPTSVLRRLEPGEHLP